MSKKQLYPVNPDRTRPWNELPELPIDTVALPGCGDL
jgi:hypothetical protein